MPATEKSPITILIVDDDAPVRHATSRILQLKGFLVFTAEGADEARRVMETHGNGVHLLLSDVIMPNESGPVMTAGLVKKYPHLKVLYMSGYAGDELGEHGYIRRDTTLIRKPFTIDELLDRIRDVLSGPPGRA